MTHFHSQPLRAESTSICSLPTINGVLINILSIYSSHPRCLYLIVKCLFQTVDRIVPNSNLLAQNPYREQRAAILGPTGLLLYISLSHVSHLLGHFVSFGNMLFPNHSVAEETESELLKAQKLTVRKDSKKIPNRKSQLSRVNLPMYFRNPQGQCWVVACRLKFIRSSVSHQMSTYIQIFLFDKDLGTFDK